MVVLDASVITKWFKADEKSSEASFYLEQHESGQEVVFVPVLVRYEIVNALRYSKKLSRDELGKAIFLLGETKLNYVFPDDALLASSLKISIDSSVSIYDATYVALAEQLNCAMITADERLYQKVKGKANIVLL